MQEYLKLNIKKKYYYTICLFLLLILCFTYVATFAFFDFFEIINFQIIDYFNDLKLVEFTLIPDSPEMGGLIRKPDKDLLRSQLYGCGCFWFKQS